MKMALATDYRLPGILNPANLVDWTPFLQTHDTCHDIGSPLSFSPVPKCTHTWFSVFGHCGTLRIISLASTRDC